MSLFKLFNQNKERTIFSNNARQSNGYSSRKKTKMREFKSNDKLVGELATKIDKRIPGHVKGVNVNLKMKNGNPKEVDIVTKKEIIEVKSGKNKGKSNSIGEQLRIIKEISRKEPIGYAPKLTKTEKDKLQKEGFNVFWNDDNLIDYLEKKRNKVIKRRVVSDKEHYSYRRKK